MATDRFTGEQLACKMIGKRLSVPNVAAAKQAQHLDKIRRELEVLPSMPRITPGVMGLGRLGSPSSESCHGGLLPMQTVRIIGRPTCVEVAGLHLLVPEGQRERCLPAA